MWAWAAEKHAIVARRATRTRSTDPRSTKTLSNYYAFSISFDLRDNLSNLEEASCFKLLMLVDSHPAITKAEDQECFHTHFKKLKT